MYKKFIENNTLTLPMSIVVSSLVVAGTLLLSGGGGGTGVRTEKQTQAAVETALRALEEAVIPSEGVVLPVVWGDLGVKLAQSGAIDVDKFVPLYESRGAFPEEYKNLLAGKENGRITITRENAGYLLNLFWALGLAQKNPILEKGEMVDPAYGGAQNFASTGGWTMAAGDAMKHYSQHAFFELTAEGQVLVDKVSRGVYRPCCNNSTHFPDCNHGMAMLGLLELMASQGASEEEMWQAALAVNSYWFPDTYLTIATYMEGRGVSWGAVDPREVLGKDYSSASGYAKIAAQVGPLERGGSGPGCGVSAADIRPAVAVRKQQGCGV